MKKILLKLLVKWYLAENREIHKISLEDEIKLFKFSKAEDTEKLMKSIMTAQTLLYWEVKDDTSRNIVKGSAMILKIMLDAHKKAIEIRMDVDEKDDEKKVSMWRTFKKSNRTK